MREVCGDLGQVGQKPIELALQVRLGLVLLKLPLHSVLIVSLCFSFFVSKMLIQGYCEDSGLGQGLSLSKHSVALRGEWWWLKSMLTRCLGGYLCA